jgi:hypothetical protein
VVAHIEVDPEPVLADELELLLAVELAATLTVELAALLAAELEAVLDPELAVAPPRPLLELVPPAPPVPELASLELVVGPVEVVLGPPVPAVELLGPAADPLVLLTPVLAVCPIAPAPPAPGAPPDPEVGLAPDESVEPLVSLLSGEAQAVPRDAAIANARYERTFMGTCFACRPSAGGTHAMGRSPAQGIYRPR